MAMPNFDAMRALHSQAISGLHGSDQNAMMDLQRIQEERRVPNLKRNTQPGQQGVGAAIAAMRKKNRPQQPKAIPSRAVTQTAPYGGGAPSAPTTRI